MRVPVGLARPPLLTLAMPVRMCLAVSEKIYLRDGVISPRGEPKQPGLSIGEESASGALWARLATLIKGGHLVGASFKPVYAQLGGTAALPADLGGRALVYPVLELREAQAQQFVR